MRWFIYFFTLATLLVSVAVPAQEVNEAAPDTTEDIFDEVFLQQLEKLYAKREREQAQSRKETIDRLRTRYPDLVPDRESFPSGDFYHRTFDTTLANTVFFALGSSYLTDVQVSKLEAIADAMIEAPEVYLLVEGHSAGNDQVEEGEDRLFYNRWISGRRAVQVWNYMTRDRGIDPNRITMYARGSEKLLNDENSESQRALNRRVELRLTSQPTPLVPPRRSTQPNTASTPNLAQ